MLELQLSCQKRTTCQEPPGREGILPTDYSDYDSYYENPYQE